MTDKEQYLEDQISEKNQFWISKVLIIGSVLFPFIGIADYFVTPENFQRFILYRLCITVIFIIAYFLNNLKRNSAYQYTIISTITILSAATVELMILSFGGHTSTYYAGINLIIITALSLIPFGLVLSISVTLSIYGVYLIPILLFDTITNVPVFIANNVFILSTIAIALTWRLLNQKTMLNELSLQYDLAEGKQKLEQYSNRLEQLVTERTKDLNKSEQWHRSLFENATDGIIVLDKNGIIVNVNEKACTMHGFTQKALIGTSIKLLENSDTRENTKDRMRRMLDGEALVYETTHYKKDGTPFYLEISSQAIAIGDELFIQSFYRDITEKKLLQEHLFQSQKMDSIGVLAGGIAHDFNNILTAILGHTEIVRRGSTMNERGARSLAVIEDASRRAGRMISKLLGFARESTYELSPLNLNDVVYDTIKLLEQVIDKNINLSIELDNQLPMIHADINQMEQVIMNLIVNARDAMPKGGRITIKTSARTVVRGMPDIPPYIPPGEYVQFSIADTGTGIPEELVNKIFEPFFTTKERGKGTGLGLSMVYGAVKEHQGYLSVQSTLGSGSMFSVFLPVSFITPPTGVREPLAPYSGNETLLLVDDEEEILISMQEALESHGYKVWSTTDSTAALEMYREGLHETALVITDIVMPRMDGMELIRQIKLLNQDVKILAISGHTKYVAEKEEIKEINGFLQKPFESYYLLSVVRRILDTKTKKAIPA